MENVAFHKPATQSSTSQWSVSGDRAIDAGVATSGNLDSPQCFHTGNEFQPWWQVDLRGAFSVGRIVLLNRDGFQDRCRRFTLFRSLDGMEWFEVHRKTSDDLFDEYGVDFPDKFLARFVRLRLDGANFLHLRQVQVFGAPCAPEDQAGPLAEEEALRRRRRMIPEGRAGHICFVGGFYVFADDRYEPRIVGALDDGGYEGPERRLALEFLRAGDRVLELGAAIGVLSMTAASIVGAEAMKTFDANPAIVADARDNFWRNGLEAISADHGLLVNRKNFRPGETRDFHIAKEFWASRLDAGPNPGDIVATVNVPVLCLEDEIAAHRANVLLCDIEGGEVDLLSGADLSGIRLIVMETHYWAVGEEATDAMIRELILQGFNLHLGASGAHVSVLRR